MNVKLTGAMRDRIFELRHEGWTLIRIAKEVGLSEGRISTILSGKTYANSSNEKRKALAHANPKHAMNAERTAQYEESMKPMQYAKRDYSCPVFKASNGKVYRDITNLVME